MIYDREDWKKETKNKILEVIKSMGINRMPSRSELKMVTGGEVLSNKIIRSGGYKFWAKQLEVDLKNCETYFADKYENKTADYLKQTFENVKMTPVKFPYDIVINNSTKIDVKASRLYRGKNGSFYTFNLESKYPKSDFYVAYCVGNNEETIKILIIPSFVMSGKKQLSVGEKSIYDKYSNRWDLIEMHVKMMEKFII